MFFYYIILYSISQYFSRLRTRVAFGRFTCVNLHHDCQIVHIINFGEIAYHQIEDLYIIIAEADIYTALP